MGLMAVENIIGTLDGNLAVAERTRGIKSERGYRGGHALEERLTTRPVRVSRRQHGRKKTKHMLVITDMGLDDVVVILTG